MSETNTYMKLNQRNPALLEELRTFAMMSSSSEVKPSIWQLESMLTKANLLQYVQRYNIQVKKDQDPLEALMEQGDQRHLLNQMPEGYDADGNPLETTTVEVPSK